MMVKSIAGCLLAVLLVVLSQVFFSTVRTPPTLGSAPAPVRSAPPTAPLLGEKTPMSPAVPQIDRVTLWQFLEDLNYERHTESQRQRTRDYLSEKLRSFGLSPQKQVFDLPRDNARDKGVNIWAQRPGSNSQAGKVIVAAHYDTVAGSPGADDNGSGVATVLEIARLFAQHPTPATLQVIFFDAEEQGMLGSFAFTDVAAHRENVEAAIVLEMVGFACYQPDCQTYPQSLPIEPPSRRGNFLAVVGNSEHPFLLQAFSQDMPAHLPPVETLAVPAKGALFPAALRSDHAPFWWHDIPAVMVTDTANFRNPHYHQPSDTINTINRDFFTGSAQIAARATAHLLAQPEKNTATK
ncbi:M20/M25/M40 family metallo-hydrolase [Geitlerinema sp. PCC 9228]|uniref:M20/M25/M40 family metallo-hydrolase n=1 Tax=Geitlerinema sp. PCC 9228 TaxID=111611 RepID=UPI000B25DA14|nr:M20/M25/M40 family metallo-hydrolase [Geitlerinema sp. PCC 9228]